MPLIKEIAMQEPSERKNGHCPIVRGRFFRHPVDINTSSQYSHRIKKIQLADNTSWIRKAMDTPMQARSTLLACEFLRLICEEQPETRLVCHGDLGTYYILSNEVLDFEPLPRGKQRDFNEGIYTGLGEVLLVSLFLFEVDLKNGNVGLNHLRQVIKIDGDWSFAHMRDPGQYVLSDLTRSQIMGLPDLVNPQAYNWLDMIEERQNPRPSKIVDNNFSNSAYFRQERWQAILKILLLPSEYIQQLVEGTMPAQDAELFVTFIRTRQMQLEAAVLNDAAFQTYLASAAAEQLAVKFNHRLQQFSINQENILAHEQELVDFTTAFSLRTAFIFSNKSPWAHKRPSWFVSDCSLSVEEDSSCKHSVVSSEDNEGGLWIDSPVKGGTPK